MLSEGRMQCKVKGRPQSVEASQDLTRVVRGHWPALHQQVKMGPVLCVGPLKEANHSF